MKKVSDLLLRAALAKVFAGTQMEVRTKKKKKIKIKLPC